MDGARPQYSPCVEVSLDNLLHNLAQIRSRVPDGIGIIAVVKDCSYGCGSIMTAQTLEREGGVNFFAVARTSEAAALRKSGIRGTVLVLGYATEEELRFGAGNNVVFALNDMADIDRWKSYGINVRFHLNVDTGMTRDGLLPCELDMLINALKSSPGICLDGIFTHMACADEPNTSTVGLQREKFMDSVAAIRQSGINPPHIHYGNTPATIRFPLEGCTHARPGIALYGCKPDPAQDFGIDLRPVVSLKSHVVKMKKVGAGTAVSYGGNYVTSSETWIATIHLGYAHGLPRFLSSKGEVLIGGRRYRIAGNVTMDYIMVDAGADPLIAVGDEAVAIGSQGGETITPDDVALIGKTIGYEVICNLGTAIDRFYTRNGKIIHHDPGVIF
ncbi:MAG: alanine racemase [Chitinispirillia bacterium]|nr:alanine racemase [Chitinispirillia bacterium]MCL2242477.1 alanine racemase [Chitinispirillia bacterium]